MKDVILTLVVVFIIYKIITSFRDGNGPRRNNDHDDHGSRGGKVGDVHIDYLPKERRKSDDEGYTDYEEIK